VAALWQPIPLPINATELALSGSQYVYLSGVGNRGSNIAGWSIQADGTLAPITGTPFGSGVNAYGLAASPDGSRIFANDLQQQNTAWFAVNSTGALTLGGTTAPNSIVPGERMMVDRSWKFLYSTAAIPALHHRDAKLPFGVVRSAAMVRLRL